MTGGSFCVHGIQKVNHSANTQSVLSTLISKWGPGGEVGVQNFEIGVGEEGGSLAEPPLDPPHDFKWNGLYLHGMYLQLAIDTWYN